MGLGAVMLGACAEPVERPEQDEEGEVVVEPAAGARLCAEMEPWIEAEIERVGREVGLRPAFELGVTLGASAVATECVEPGDIRAVQGCTVGDGAAVAVVTTPGTFAHELVHALRRHQGLRTRPLFEEGFAELRGGSDAYPRVDQLEPAALAEVRQPEAMIELGPSEFRDGQSYRAAAHFLAFVEQTDGPEALASFMRGGLDDSAADARRRFELHFGASLSERAEAWRQQGPHEVSEGDPCTGGAEPLPATGARIEVTVDCDAPGTMGLAGAEETAWRRTCVAVEAGRYVIALEAEAGSVYAEPAAGSCDPSTSALDRAPFGLEAGEQAALELGACTWALTFASTRDQPEALVLRVDPG